MNVIKPILAASVLALAWTMPAAAQDQDVVMAANTTGTPDERAAAMLAQMTPAEKLILLKGYFGSPFGGFPGSTAAPYVPPEEVRLGSAGYVPGIPRLGIPPQWETDAGIGVASQQEAVDKKARTALPSGLATAATWDPALAYAGGAMIGSEARATGFNVMLAGSVNLMREPRNGRNFEYAGEDPLLAGSMVGPFIAGVQSNEIISTIKHYALNDQETARNTGNFELEESAFRMSDLLAFQIAIEQGHPGSVMCAYNLVGGIHACENPWLLTKVLRTDWNWPGYVMTDWGAAHSTAPSVRAGLDQESGYGLQRDDWFGAEKLQAALDSGEIDNGMIDTMAGRILRSMFAHGLIDNPVEAASPIPFEANRAVSQADAQAAIVLLKNEDNLLPLTGAKRIAVIGGHADKGVISGGGSSQVYPDGVNAVPGIAPTTWPGPVVFNPSAPLQGLQDQLPGATFAYSSGDDPDEAAQLAAEADIAIVFGTQWASESIDVPLTLGEGQDALVATVAKANPNTVVVLETAGPVMMPWADKVKGIVEAWFPGRMGGAAIASVLTGTVNPSGHLPATFPRSLDQLPHPEEPHPGTTTYDEGVLVGYKWYDAKGFEPLFPFGYGLSYTSFAYSDLTVRPMGDGIVATVRITNTGDRAGADVAQLYLSGPEWPELRRLGGFAKVTLEPGQSTVVGIKVDPRLLSVWDTGAESSEGPGWLRRDGDYTVSVGYSSRDMADTAYISLPARHLPPEWKP
ncbi:glycosyl hydrolase [Altererythrobacter salegens]|uniref:Glycosyl hydrolase n=1 Tax=Croceibacterium salegens TaxID=1737568 RepID=A0A6I4STT3_9SPHN|nr:glycoside hydrolase family 3 C-terminal domain-containing protein [Croceibacterium salegens]MXO58467.1 glycosyl hydrolase [Croceibacterium salegens]